LLYGYSFNIIQWPGWQNQGYAWYIVPRTYTEKVGLIDWRIEGKRGRREKKRKEKKEKKREKKRKREKKKKREKRKKKESSKEEGGEGRNDRSQGGRID